MDIDTITAKANRTLGLVKRTSMELKDITTLRTLYCSLIRPLLEYSCETWNPYTQRNINRLESVQRRTTKFILKSKDDYYTRLLVKFTELNGYEVYKGCSIFI